MQPVFNATKIKASLIHTKRNGLSLLVHIFTLMTFLSPAVASGPLVVVQQVEQQPLIEEIPLTGSVVALRNAQLSTEVSGVVKKIDVEIGDAVNAGDELLQIDAELAELNLGLAQAETLKTKEELADAERRLADTQSLVKKKTVSENELNSLKAEVQIKRAELTGFEAKEKHQQSLLQRYRLSAPFDGVIAQRGAELGEWIQPGVVAFQLVAIDQLHIEFQVPQTVFSKITNTAAVEVKLDAFPAQLFSGDVERVIPVTDPTTRTFTIRVVLEEQNTRLAPGMSASAILKVSLGSEAVVVPRDALMRYPDGRVTVWQVEEDGGESKVRERQVKTGLSFDGRIAITDGIQNGATIVVQGNESLREGQQVTVRR